MASDTAKTTTGTSAGTAHVEMSKSATHRLLNLYAEKFEKYVNLTSQGEYALVGDGDVHCITEDPNQIIDYLGGISAGISIGIEIQHQLGYYTASIGQIHAADLCDKIVKQAQSLWGDMEHDAMVFVGTVKEWSVLIMNAELYHATFRHTYYGIITIDMKGGFCALPNYLGDGRGSDLEIEVIIRNMIHDISELCR